MKRKEKNIVFRREKIIGILIVCAVFLLSIGFSESSIDLGIDSLAVAVRVQKDIRVTGISMTSTTNDAVSNWEDYNYNNVTAGITLPNSNSTVTYEIEITNIGNIESMIDSITGLQSNLSYTLNNYTIGDVLCDDNDPGECMLGTETTISITIGYQENGYDSTNTNYNINMLFSFDYIDDKVAKAGNRYFDTLQLAVASVDPNNTDPTLVVLLKDTAELITVNTGQKIILDLKTFTLRNDPNNNKGNVNVIINNGTLTIKNGYIKSDASGNGAIQNNENCVMTIDGTNIEMTGGKQAIYNNKGTMTLKGDITLYSTGNQRAAVHNVTPGIMTIESGTYTATSHNTILTESGATLTIGIEDGHVDLSTPTIINTNTSRDAVSVPANNTVYFFDGMIKGRSKAISATNRANSRNEGPITEGTEYIDSNQYKVLYIGSAITLSLRTNSGTCSGFASNSLNTIRTLIPGSTAGTLPDCFKSGYLLVGFFDDPNGGNEITSSTRIYEDVTIYPHWQKTSEVAQIGATKYDTLQEAISAAPADTLTEITLLKDVQEVLTVSSAKKIILNANNKKISNCGVSPVIENSGDLTINNGNFESSTSRGIINNNAGNLLINGGNYDASGDRQVLYITGGTVTIDGNAYMISLTTGTASGTTMERGTVQNISGTLIIKSATIIGDKQQAVSNEGTLVIGVDDGTIDTNSISLIGNECGVKSSVAFDFFDGASKGRLGDIIGTVIDHNDNTEVVHDHETYQGENFYIAYKDYIS